MYTERGGDDSAYWWRMWLFAYYRWRMRQFLMPTENLGIFVGGILMWIVWRCSGPYLDGKFVVHDGIFDSVITSMMDYLMVWIVSMMGYSVVWSARVMDYPIVWTVNHEGIFDGMAVSMMGCSMVWITSMVGIFDSVNCKHDRNIRSVNCRYDGTLIVWL